jgi:hypothetical protein
MTKTHIGIAAAILSFLTITTLVFGMGLFDFMKVCIFSEVGGVVTMAGKPVAGVEIIRTANYDDKDYIDKTVTDALGRFHFEPMFSYSLLKWDPTIFQKIVLRYKGKEYIGWDKTRGNYDLNGELDGNILISDLVCELDHEPTVKYQDIRGNVYGICKW